MSPLQGVLTAARKSPGIVLGWVIGAHVLIWTLLPILVCPNLALDLAEGLALGKEWQLGYWKHPPLPWWIVAGAYDLTGQLESVYLLGPLAVALALYVVWRLGCEVMTPLNALIAALALEGLHFFNFTAVKFNHDVLLLPLWALAAFFFYRALAGRRLIDWAVAGLCLSLGFWTKYNTVALGVVFAYVLIFERDARDTWRTGGPYVMGLVFLATLSPNLWWLAHNDYTPFHYAQDRSVVASSWVDYFAFPLRFTTSQIFFLLPTLGLLAVVYAGREMPARARTRAFARRYVTALAIGPFLFTVISAAALGRMPHAMWGYPLWTFAPLAILVWFAPHQQTRRLSLFAAAFTGVFVIFAVAYAVAELFGPILNDRVKATNFPGRDVARTITERWHQRTGTPLTYVGGIASGYGPGEFAANNVAVYSADRPHVIVHGQLSLSPWVTRADLQRRGAVFVWEQVSRSAVLPPDLKAAYPRAELQPTLVLKRQNPFSHAEVLVNYAILAPSP